MNKYEIGEPDIIEANARLLYAIHNSSKIKIGWDSRPCDWEELTEDSQSLWICMAREIEQNGYSFGNAPAKSSPDLDRLILYGKRLLLAFGILMFLMLMSYIAVVYAQIQTMR